MRIKRQVRYRVLMKIARVEIRYSFALALFLASSMIG